MLMVDNLGKKESCFGYTNLEGKVEFVSLDTEDEVVKISLAPSGCGATDVLYPEDVPKLIKALEHMQKYLVDEGIIQ